MDNYQIKGTIISVVLCGLLTSCAEMKEAGTTIGHTARDVTKEIGHGTVKAVKAVGKGTKRVVESIKEESNDDSEEDSEGN